jgi:molybdenum cofactor cytidylyltransferase
MNNMRITGILLAAGAGVRFGGAKLLAPLPDGTSIGQRAAANLVTAIPDVIAVVRPGDDALARVLAEAGARVSLCAEAVTGMGASLAHGVRVAGECAGAPDGFVVALADMPWIDPRTIRAVAAKLQSGAQLVAPRYRGQRGHPIGFGASHRAALLGLTGDAGARAIVAAAGDPCWLDVDDPGIVRDVDVRADLAGPPVSPTI